MREVVVVEQKQDQRRLLWRADAGSMVSLTLGRVTSTLLSARPKKLQDAVSRFSPDLRASSVGSLEESLVFLYRYVRDAAERKERLDHILVPMFENSLRGKGSRLGGQTLILLNWLFEDDCLFQYIMENLADILSRKDDRYILLGWCTLVRGILECESALDQYSLDGLRGKYFAIVEMLCPCISHLSSIMHKGSTLQDGYELPSRLSISAADCFLSLTEALARKHKNLTNQKNCSHSSISIAPRIHLPAADDVEKEKGACAVPSQPENLLSSQLEELINVVQLLVAWSKKSRPLHARGLEGVLKWLLDIKKHYRCLPNETSLDILRTRELLLSSCWKHYSMLLHLEDHRFSQHYTQLLEQYLSGIQFYAERRPYRHEEYDDAGGETRYFFLNCLCLLLGRLVGKRFEATVLDYGSQISQILLPQLNCADEDVIDTVVCIFKAAIFKLSGSSQSILMEKRQLDVMLPFLLQLLDERDGTARAAAILIAEYCTIETENQCVKEILVRLSCEDTIQRRNAIDVISELISIASKTQNGLPHLEWQDIASSLLGCLNDGESMIRELASDTLSVMEPSLVLPALVRLLNSSENTLQTSARKAFTKMLRSHKRKSEVIFMLLDCLCNLNSSLDIPRSKGDKFGESKIEVDQVLSLTSEWCDSVQDWNTLVGQLIDKMFDEPSNAVIVRFLSYLSEHLGNTKEIVLDRILLCMQGQKEMDENLLTQSGSICSTSYDSERLQRSLFKRLCPLLIIRILPLRVFDDLNSSVMYGQLVSQGIVRGALSANVGADIIDDRCVSALLLKRAISKVEFEDVRKLAAELCGRLHPQVLFPIMYFHLEDAVHNRDILKIKACLFSVCTSLVVRGRDPAFDPALVKIIKFLEAVLLWPSLDGDSVAKAQHGCIDCLALMICAELQASHSSGDSTFMEITVSGKKGTPDSHSVLGYVISQLIDEVAPNSDSHFECPVLSFRLCMANALISACQKIAEAGVKPFAQTTIPVIVHSVEVILDPEIRAACFQVLFSAVYHLKSAVLPYSSDLLKLSIRHLKEGSEKERMAAAKLMASLMASEDAILVSISGGLVEARSVLSTLSKIDPSKDIRQICQKLLSCISSS